LSTAKKAFKSCSGVLHIETEYMRWAAVYKRPSLVGDSGPAPRAASTQPTAKAICASDNRDPSTAEVTPWGIKYVQADDSVLRGISTTSSMLFCVIDSGQLSSQRMQS
jgi:hypothetical protein